MDYITVALITTAASALLAFAFFSGYELGESSGVQAERDLANRRVNSLLTELNKLKPTGRRLTYRKVDPRSVGKRKREARS